jgi:hypothetical protein
MGILTTERSNADDVKITFESKNGEIELFLSVSKIGAKSNKEIVQEAGDEIACAIGCAQKSGSALCYIRCLRDGKVCDSGATNCD